MINKYRTVCTSVLMGLLAAPVVFAAGPASAQQLIRHGLPPLDPVIAYAQAEAPANQFFLNSSDDVEIVRFKQPRDMSVCIPKANPDAIGAAAASYAVKVSWDGNSSVVSPGNCMTFDAAHVSVRPATPLPQDVALTGMVHVLK